MKEFDYELTFGQVECLNIGIIRKSHILATVLSAIVLDPSCFRVNYDHDQWTNPLKDKRIWTDAWAVVRKQVGDSMDKTVYKFDMAEAIQGFYLNGNNNLEQSSLLPEMPNHFCFDRTRST